MTEIEVHTQDPKKSPFDRLMLLDSDGEERWSARRLMKPLGYQDWGKFLGSIERAIATARNTGMDVDQAFRRLREKGQGRPKVDYQLTREAAYLVALNGDPRKPEISAAQRYFVNKAREAELSLANLPDDADARELELIDRYRRAALDRIEARRELAIVQPVAERHEFVMDVDGGYSLASVARQLGFGGMTRVFNQMLIDMGALYRLPRLQLTATQDWVDKGYMVIRNIHTPVITEQGYKYLESIDWDADEDYEG